MYSLNKKLERHSRSEYKSLDYCLDAEKEPQTQTLKNLVRCAPARAQSGESMAHDSSGATLADADEDEDAAAPCDRSRNSTSTAVGAGAGSVKNQSCRSASDAGRRRCG